MNQKPFSAAAYRQHAAKVKEAAPTEMVTLKSGAVFELRRPDLQGYVVTGRLPQSLLNVGFAAWKKQGKAPDAQTIAANLNDEDANDMLIFMRELVHEACANPKFVEFAINDDEIGAADMLPQDFSEIFQWAMSGQEVTAPDGLKSFRDGRPGATAPVSTDGEKQRRSRKRLTPLERAIR